MRRSHYYDQHSSGFLFLHAYGKDFSSLGQVKEISYTGATYEYIDEGSAHPGLVEIDIFSSNSGLILQRVRARVINDVSCGIEIPFSRIPTRRCSVEFLDTTEEQRKRLSILLAKKILAHMNQNCQGIRKGR
jgi:hypothetical protein